MIDIILNALVYILAIYGLIEIIKTIYYIMEYTNLSEDRNIHNYCYKKSGRESTRNSWINTV